ncbi:type VI immunity family protein [Pseudomonas sp. GCM10022188]|uniref:type VI immunity family protein n=1 Tax=Pseudomonas TaxID=286 RepID=UPI001E4DE6EB|nr:type VI immunity family protein [Pseudomonas oryzagri]MCC6076018.1 DUF3396 domain-containing protein [Pseudomonas oryzagri]
MNILEKLQERVPDLEFEMPDGTPVVKLGLIATLYFKDGYTSDLKQKVVQCFERFYMEFKPQLKWHVYRRDKKLTDNSFQKTTTQILATGPNDQIYWSLSSSEGVHDAPSYCLSVMNSHEIHAAQDRSYIKLALPWSLLIEPNGLDRYNQWLVYLCNQVKAEHGYGGLSSALPNDYDSYMPTEYQLAQQYSGLEVDTFAYSMGRELINHIKGVNWYTVIGNGYVDRLGGEAAIRHALSGHGDIEILRYDYGLIIRAGQYPELGAEEDGLPQAYVAVNKVVRPLRIPNPDQLHSYSPYGDCFDQESTDRWYARFDQDELHSTPTRIVAGQPCTHAGYWFTPAQPHSRRHFAEGEIMPCIEDSSWGDTLWYWSNEGHA